MTNEQKQYQLNRINLILKSNLNMPEDNKQLLLAQREQLMAELGLTDKEEEPAAEVKTPIEEYIDNIPDEKPTEEVKEQVDPEYAEKVDKFINNIEVEVEAPEQPITNYKDDLLYALENYKQRTKEHYNNLKSDCEAQEKLLAILKTHIGKEFTVLDTKIMADIKSRENIIENFKIAMQIAESKLAIHTEIVDFVEHNYDHIAMLDRYLGGPMQLQETIDYEKSFRPETDERQ